MDFSPVPFADLDIILAGTDEKDEESMKTLLKIIGAKCITGVVYLPSLLLFRADCDNRRHFFFKVTGGELEFSL